MIVKELIEELQTRNPDDVVYLMNDSVMLLVKGIDEQSHSLKEATAIIIK